MKRACHPNDLAHDWTLSQDERALLANKTGATRLGFALLLKIFQLDGRFPERREEIAEPIVTYLAQQVGVSPDDYFAVDWSERTQRQRRAQIRDYCGFRVFGAQDEAEFVTWLRERVTALNPEAEALKLAAYSHLRAQRIEPPRSERLRRLLGEAVRQRESQPRWHGFPRRCVRPWIRSSRRARSLRMTATWSKPPSFPYALNSLPLRRMQAP